MTAVSVINMVLPIAALIALIAALLFIIRGVQRRTHAVRVPYNVGRQEARQGMQFDFVRAIILLALSLILFGVFLLLPEPTEAELAPTGTPVPTLAAATPLPPTEPSAPSLPTAAASPTTLPTVGVSTPSAVPTSTPSPEPLPTATPVVETAVVISGVGVWLRSVPGVDGEQVEWLLPDTQVALLAGQATADEFEWQEVQAPSGNVGWVAVPFIEPIVP